MTTRTWDGRCRAAYVADPRQCEGPADAVSIVDRTGVSTVACVVRGAVLLASQAGGRVRRLNGAAGPAVEVYRRARTLAPSDFLTGPEVQRVTTVDGAAVFPSAVGPPARGPQRLR